MIQRLGSAFIKFKQSFLANTIQRTLDDKLKESVSVKDFGVKGDGITDDYDLIKLAIAATAGKCKLVFPAGVYLVRDCIEFTTGSNIEAYGATIRLTQRSTLGGLILTGGKVEATDVIIRGLTADCNMIAGENAFNGVFCKRIRMYDVVAINVLHHEVALGGRAFQYEGATVEDVTIYNPVITNCSIGINSQADPAGSTKVRGVTYVGVVMEDVGAPFNVDAQYANPETSTPVNMSTTVLGASLRNCGRLKGFGTSPVGGGIINGDRGAGLFITGLRVVNDFTYGGIGAFIRGQLFGIVVRDADVFLEGGATAFIDHNPVGFGRPSAMALASQVDVDCRFIGNLDYIVKSHTPSFGAHRVNLQLDVTKATLAAMFDQQAALNTNAMYNITNLVNGRYTGWRYGYNFVDNGNTLSVTGMTAKGRWTPTVSGWSGLTVNGATYERQGDIVHFFMNVTFPAATSNTAQVRIAGLPFPGSSLGGNSSGGASVSFCSAPSANAPTNVIVTPGSAKDMGLFKGNAVVTQADLAGRQLVLTGMYHTTA